MQPGRHQCVRYNNELNNGRPKTTNKEWERQYQSAPPTPATVGEVSINLPGTPDLSPPNTTATKASDNLLPFHNFKDPD